MFDIVIASSSRLQVEGLQLVRHKGDSDFADFDLALLLLFFLHALAVLKGNQREYGEIEDAAHQEHIDHLLSRHSKTPIIAARRLVGGNTKGY